MSIRTGNPGKKAIEDNMLKLLSKTMVAMVTETGKTEISQHQESSSHNMADLVQTNPAPRFSGG
jgi:hypothetical protein